ncbi:DUF4375 domain-containing protein [Rhizobium sp. KVB221]|uniref:DUF4375 domain-containing protein n=1 Tax=Rhizobium setariae TaxID=2801340 RepID=A0A936YNS0_9HYPH|nr:DUF4375 domain-containing protein [Rhizobium setariae]MBL0373979.1 DUF4375 domain-containing protein [Rhizobium setariae]
MANPESTILSSNDLVMVSTDAFESVDPYDIIQSNISVINELFSEHLKPEEVSRAALTSYYVDFYLAQVNNGGFSQFVFNSDWNEEIVNLVRQGLREMGASRHSALFEEGAAAVRALGEERLITYLGSDYWSENIVRNSLDTIDDRFYALGESEDLVKLNAIWLKRQPNLLVLSIDKLWKEVDHRSSAAPDRAKRMERALQAQPRYIKAIRELCEKSGQKLDQVTAGAMDLFYDGKVVRQLTPEELEGRGNIELQTVWYFITDKGLHLMAEVDGKAAMFDNETKTRIAEIDISSEL